MAVDQDGRPLRSPRARAEAEAVDYGRALGWIIGDRRARRGAPWDELFDMRCEGDDIREAYFGLRSANAEEAREMLAGILRWLWPAVEDYMRNPRLLADGSARSRAEQWLSARGLEEIVRLGMLVGPDGAVRLTLTARPGLVVDERGDLPLVFGARSVSLDL